MKYKKNKVKKELKTDLKILLFMIYAQNFLSNWKKLRKKTKNNIYLIIGNISLN